MQENINFRASPIMLAGIDRLAGPGSIRVTLDRYGHLFPGAEGEAARVWTPTWTARSVSDCRAPLLATPPQEAKPPR